MRTSRSRHCRIVLAAVFCCLAWVYVVPGVEHAATFRAALESIRAERLKADVDFLADDAREGREAGSRGGRAAGDYLVGQLAKLGLQGAGTDGAFGQCFVPNYRNILALLEGSDLKMKNELVVVGAHYDHIGYGTRQNSRGPIGQIHNGADDNASGAFQSAGTGPGLQPTARPAAAAGLVRILGCRRERPARLEALGRLSLAAASSRRLDGEPRHGRPAAKRSAHGFRRKDGRRLAQPSQPGQRRPRAFARLPLGHEAGRRPLHLLSAELARAHVPYRVAR